MNIYTVKEKFKDLDNNHIYKENDLYPFNLEEVDSKRIAELEGNKNKMKKKLIEKKTIEDLSVNQLVRYAEIKDIDIKTSIINKILESNKNIGKDSNNKNKSKNTQTNSSNEEN